MVQPSEPPPTATPAPKPRLADRVIGPFDALQIITEGDPEKAEAALERLVESDGVEREILVELARSGAVAEPNRFPAAHRSFARGLEIYDRNSQLSPTQLPAGPLMPVVRPLVGFLARSIARRHQRRVVGEVRKLYLLREAASAVDGSDHLMLRPASSRSKGWLPT